MNTTTYSLVFLCLVGFCTCQKEAAIFQPIAPWESLTGDYNNFQQCWQENTQEEKHRTATEELHELWHLQVVGEALKDSDKKKLWFQLSPGRDSGALEHQFALIFQDQGTSNSWTSEYWEGGKKGKAETVKLWHWTYRGGAYEAVDAEGKIQLSVDSVGTIRYWNHWNSAERLVEPYQMMTCRYFSGWIELPDPQQPGQTLRQAQLRIHDQGGLLPLHLEDLQYSVELTQLVYAKKIEIMKLAIYQEPLDSINYHSRSIAYTWANPEAKRIGMNLRKISSGWTLIEPGYLNSDNLKSKK